MPPSAAAFQPIRRCPPAFQALQIPAGRLSCGEPKAGAKNSFYLLHAGDLSLCINITTRHGLNGQDASRTVRSSRGSSFRRWLVTYRTGSNFSSAFMMRAAILSAMVGTVGVVARRRFLPVNCSGLFRRVGMSSSREQQASMAPNTSWQHGVTSLVESQRLPCRQAVCKEASENAAVVPGFARGIKQR